MNNIDAVRVALERIGCQDGGSCDENSPDGKCFVCKAIDALAGVSADAERLRSHLHSADMEAEMRLDALQEAHEGLAAYGRDLRTVLAARDKFMQELVEKRTELNLTTRERDDARAEVERLREDVATLGAEVTQLNQEVSGATALLIDRSAEQARLVVEVERLREALEKQPETPCYTYENVSTSKDCIAVGLEGDNLCPSCARKAALAGKDGG